MDELAFPSRLKTAVVLVAAGRGARARRDAFDDLPKQFRPVAGRPVLAHTLDVFLAHPLIDDVIATIHPDDAPLYADAVSYVAESTAKLHLPAMGGASRQASVYAGLQALADRQPDLVLIHDGVRPFIAPATIDALIAELTRHPAVLAGSPVVDTVKRVDPDGLVGATVPRDGLWRAATPQGFRFSRILDQHGAAVRADKAHIFTDDAAVAEWAGDGVRMVMGNDDNVKLTLPEDFAAAEARLTRDTYARLADVRVGTGYDVHSFVPGDKVTLCGVTIPHSHKLNGHSDSDVALHAVTDAILGAIGEGDIGQHFPPTQEQWRGADSRIFVEDAIRRVKARGGMVAHIDVSLIAEAPKVGPHREAMRQRLAEIAGISLDRVGIKATTNEKLGFIGRKEGIAAIATVTIRLPI